MTDAKIIEKLTTMCDVSWAVYGPDNVTERHKVMARSWIPVNGSASHSTPDHGLFAVDHIENPVRRGETGESIATPIGHSYTPAIHAETEQRSRMHAALHLLHALEKVGLKVVKAEKP